MNEQEEFWKETYAKEYISKNKEFNRALGIKCWKDMLASADGISSVLECGCNIGRNLDFLGVALPEASRSIIEISKPAFDLVTSRFDLHRAHNGSIISSSFDDGEFDLAFTIGVLIHMAPEDLLSNMEKMYRYSRKYILIGEYFNRTPVMIEYHGKMNKLFKRDFGKLFVENFDVKLVDYGFLWGHLYDEAGFDDITWWLFEKNATETPT